MIGKHSRVVDKASKAIRRKKYLIVRKADSQFCIKMVISICRFSKMRSLISYLQSFTSTVWNFNKSGLHQSFAHFDELLKNVLHNSKTRQLTKWKD